MREKLEIDIESLTRESELYENPVTEKQKDIMRAAEELFAKHGYSDTPTAEIARKAGVTEKTLFKHFPTKVHLFKRILFPALLKTLLPMQFRKVKKVLTAPYDSYRDALAEIVRDRLDVVAQHGPRLKFVLLELAQNDSFREKFSRLWRDNLWSDFEALVARYQANGQIRSDIDKAVIARAQFYMIAGHVATRAVFLKGRKKEENEAELEQLLNILTEGVNARHQA